MRKHDIDYCTGYADALLLSPDELDEVILNIALGEKSVLYIFGFFDALRFKSEEV